MKTYRVYAMVSGTKYLGIVEAETKEEAEDKAFSLPTASISLCHNCVKQCDGADIQTVYAEEE